MKIIKPSDFEGYFASKTDQLVVSEIANQVVEDFLKNLLKDPTMGATGNFSQGYRSCLNDITRALENK